MAAMRAGVESGGQVMPQAGQQHRLVVDAGAVDLVGLAARDDDQRLVGLHAFAVGLRADGVDAGPRDRSALVDQAGRVHAQRAEGDRGAGIDAAPDVGFEMATHARVQQVEQCVGMVPDRQPQPHAPAIAERQQQVIAVVPMAHRSDVAVGHRERAQMQRPLIQRQRGGRAPPGDQVRAAPQQVAHGRQGQEEDQPHGAITQHLDQQPARQQPDVDGGQQLRGEQVEQRSRAEVAAKRVARQDARKGSRHASSGPRRGTVLNFEGLAL